MIELQYVNLGGSGLKISRIIIGCMSFGNQQPWMVEKEDAKRVIDRALDLGINCFDTANGYSNGRSEEIVGELLKDVREDVVIATKVYFPKGGNPNQRGLSREHIMLQVRDSLRRLQTDYIDLYQIHRWDKETPIEETLSTLNGLVKNGSVRYIGASSMPAWQLSKALYTSQIKGYERFTSMQNKYNLLYREEEREMMPLCDEQKVGLIPYNPLAVGLLAGRFVRDGRIVIEKTDIERLQPENRVASSYHKPYIEPPENSEIVNRVLETARSRGVKPSQIALAWLFHKKVAAPIIGTTNPEHVQEAADSTGIALSEAEVKYMEEPYVPKAVSGY